MELHLEGLTPEQEEAIMLVLEAFSNRKFNYKDFSFSVRSKLDENDMRFIAGCDLSTSGLVSCEVEMAACCIQLLVNNLIKINKSGTKRGN